MGVMKIHLMRNDEYSFCGLVSPHSVSYADGSVKRFTAADFPNKTTNPAEVTCLMCIRFSGFQDTVRHVQADRVRALIP